MKIIRDFRFKQFTIRQDQCAHQVGTDGVLLGAWADVTGAKTVLDVGTGTGVIALMLAQRTQQDVIVHGVELQQDDALQASENAGSTPWASRLKIFHQAIQNYNSDHRYDLIVSNPPFFSNSYRPSEARRNLVRHTESLSFDDLLTAVSRLLSTRGTFALILPTIEADSFIVDAQRVGLVLYRRCNFRTRRDKPIERVLMQFSIQHQALEETALLLYKDNSDSWSPDYQKLTRDFYLKL